MGTLKTDTITGLGNNNEVTLLSNKFTGTASGNITLPGEGGSTTTNLQQGLGKFWSNWDGESTVATRDSFNQSGLTDNGTGDYTTAFTNNMSNDDYAHLCSCDSANGHILEIEREAYNTTSQCRSYAFDVNPSVTDVNVAVASVLGDLA
tara:strand:- start:469 stop:915 length:447 start_codon:yes stop_codon:yes gene_type:complete